MAQPPTNIRAGHAGDVWISDDDGASIQRIRTNYKQVSYIAVNDNFIFVAFGYTAGGNTPSPTILKIPRPKNV